MSEQATREQEAREQEAREQETHEQAMAVVEKEELAQKQLQIALDAKLARELAPHMPQLETVKGMEEISPDSVRGMNPWDESLRTQRMRNGLALFNAEDIELGIPKKEKIEGDEIREGIVSFFNHDKGFGFIRDLGSGESIFVHINNVNGDELNENNRVTFEVEQGPRGFAAIKVSKA